MTRLHGVAAVQGVAAAWLERELQRLLPVIRMIQQDDVREPLLATFEDVRWAADVWRSQAVMSATGHADMPSADIDAESPHDDDEIGLDEAMRLVGIRDRHLRRLAALEGLGVKVGGRWRLSRTAVLALCERRRSA